MANIKSQIKRNRQNLRQQLRNKSIRAEIKTRIKTAVQIAEGPSGARGSRGSSDDGGDSDTGSAIDALRLAVKRIDKAASKGVIHRNQASNRKSRLMRKIAALTAGKQAG